MIRVVYLHQEHLMAYELIESVNLHFLKRQNYLFPYLVEKRLRVCDSLQYFVDEFIVILIQTSCSLDLPDYVLLPQELKQPIVPIVLLDFDLANELHVWVDTDPEDRAVV